MGYKHITSKGRTFHDEAVVNYLLFSGVDKTPADSSAGEGPPKARNTKIRRLFWTKLRSSDRMMYPGNPVMKSGSNFANTYKWAPIMEECRGPTGYLHHYCDPTHAFICADSRKPQKVFVEIAGL